MCEIAYFNLSKGCFGIGRKQKTQRGTPRTTLRNEAEKMLGRTVKNQNYFRSKRKKPK